MAEGDDAGSAYKHVEANNYNHHYQRLDSGILVTALPDPMNEEDKHYQKRAQYQRCPRLPEHILESAATYHARS